MPRARRSIPTLTNWPIYSLKAGLAAALALVLTQVLRISDPVSACFVATVCTSPTILTGLKLATEQVVGSVLGGAFATATLLVGLHGPWGLGLAVGLAILFSGLVGARHAGIVAGFTALYVALIGSEHPTTLYWERLAAVLLGALAAMLVNLALSAAQYDQVFRRRMGLAREVVAQAIEDGTQPPIDRAFALVGQVAGEMHDAMRERWVQGRALASRLSHYHAELETLRRVLHYAQEALILGEADLVPRERAAAVLRGEQEPQPDSTPFEQALVAWARHARRPDGTLPKVAEEVPTGWLTWG